MSENHLKLNTKNISYKCEMFLNVLWHFCSKPKHYAIYQKKWQMTIHTILHVSRTSSDITPMHSVITRPKKRWPERDIATVFGCRYIAEMCSQISKQRETTDGKNWYTSFKMVNTQQSQASFNANLWRANAKAMTFFRLSLSPYGERKWKTDIKLVPNCRADIYLPSKTCFGQL